MTVSHGVEGQLISEARICTHSDIKAFKTQVLHCRCVILADDKMISYYGGASIKILRRNVLFSAAEPDTLKRNVTLSNNLYFVLRKKLCNRTRADFVLQ